MTTRVCSMCREEKDIEEFRRRNSFPLRRQSYCKECGSKMGKNWYENNKEHHVQNVEANARSAKELAREFVYQYFLTHRLCSNGKGCPYNETDPAV